MYELVIIEKTIATKPQWLFGLLIPRPNREPGSNDRVLMVISRYGTQKEAEEAKETMLNDLVYQHVQK